MRLATDVGGTFTDLVTCAIDPDSGAVRITTRKVDSTPPAFEKGVLDVVDRIEPADVDFFAHGSTVVINTLLARTGAKTALITTRGFRDVLEIARGNRPDLFNFYFKKPKPFVPRRLRLELTERTDSDGRVLTPVATSELPEILELFKQNEVEAVAVCFLHAYANPANEDATLEAIRELWPDVTVVGSHAITREWREYERTSTTVLSAYVKPVAARYLHSLTSKLSERGVTVAPFVMQSNGGIGTIATWSFSRAASSRAVSSARFRCCARAGCVRLEGDAAPGGRPRSG